MNPKIGLVTVLFNSKNVFEDFFESISVQTYTNFQLFIVDNSTDKSTLPYALEIAGKYRVVVAGALCNEENLGVAAGNNQGVRLALENKCDLIVLLNNDIRFSDPETFSGLVDSSKLLPKSILAPKVYFAGTKKLWYAGGKFRPWRGNVLHYSYTKIDQDNVTEKTIEECSYAPTCFVMCHAEIFGEVGMFDEQYFVYYDDADFMLRAIRLGYKVEYVPYISIEHKVSVATGGDYSKFSVYYLNRNRLLFIRKNFGGLKLVVAIGFSVVVQGVRVLMNQSTLFPVFLNGLKHGFSEKINSNNTSGSGL